MLGPHQAHQQHRPLWIYGSICLLLLVTGAASSYYIVQDHRAVQSRKRTKAHEKEALRLLHQIKQDHLAIAQTLDTLGPEDPKRDYKLAHSNELLLRLMERLDAIQPRAAIIVDPSQSEEAKTMAYEEQAIQHIKDRKRRLIKAIEKDFQRIDEHQNRHS